MRLGVPAHLRRVTACLLAGMALLAGSASSSPAQPSDPTASAPVPPPAAAAPANGTNVCPKPKKGIETTAPGAGKTVALTFDDGPGPETPKVLAILRQYHVSATFFELGIQASTWSDFTRQVVADGHLVASHSWDHPNFRRLSSRAQRTQLVRASEQLAQITGRPPCLFRPPYGSLGKQTVAIAAALRLRTALWSVDTLDWSAGAKLNERGRKLIRTRARAGIKQKHPVILMHDGGRHRPNMLAELPGIISWYQSHGYRFVRMDG